MNDNKKFPNRIAELRKEKGMSQVELAKATGLTRQAISLYEIGKRNPSIQIWQNLSNYFKVPVDYLIGNENDSAINEMAKLASYLRNSYVHGAAKVNSSDMEELADAVLGLIYLVNDIKDQPSGIKDHDLRLVDLLFNLFKKINLFYVDDSVNPDNFRDDRQIEDYIKKTNKILVKTLKELSKMKIQRYLDND